jgi:Leucine-rich repeat (LRR) protein
LVQLIKSVEIKGYYKYFDGKYSFSFQRSPVIHKDTNLTITVKHDGGMQDRNVKMVWLEESPIFPIHLSFIEKFSRLDRFKISRSTWNFSEPLENCENFIYFELNGVDLAFIPKNFFTKCTELEVLVLEKTLILSHNVDDLFANRKNLKMLTFTNEVIPHLRDNYFTSLVNLRMLKFDRCEILKIDEDPFKSLRLLSTFDIDLSAVKVDQFLQKFFNSLENLQTFFLNGNSSSKVDDSFFVSLRTLKMLLSVTVTNIIPRLYENSFDGMSKLHTLRIQQNFISALGNNTFGRLEKIAVITLSENRIHKVEPDAFVGCETLKILNLDQNQFEFVSGLEFQHLINLQDLGLQKNAITKIIGKPFENLIKLTDLDLSTNKITSISRDLFQQNTKLESLNLASNKIYSIHPESFDRLVYYYSDLFLTENICVDEDFHIRNGDFSKLKRGLKVCFENQRNILIDCNYTITANGYACIARDCDIGNFSGQIKISEEHRPGLSDWNVKIMEFRESSLIKIPPQIFDTFENLKELIVPSVILEELNNLKNLEVFNGSSNLITEIKSNTFENCTNLKTIDLSFNKIETIADGLFEMLENLTNLNLKSNCIIEIDQHTFDGCQKLKYLNLEENRLEYLAEEAFQELADLEKLYLGSNQLFEISSYQFADLKSLRILHLDNNKLEFINASLLQPMESLEELDLSKNYLTVLDEDTFIGNPNLETLLISGNQIDKIHPKTFDGLPYIQTLDLSGNLCIVKNFEISNGIFKQNKCFANYFNFTDSCQFKLLSTGYTCLYKTVTVLENQDFFVFGNHSERKTDSDVVAVKFESSKLSKIPEEIFKDFENLKELNVESSGLKTMETLKNCENLEVFRGSNNEIEDLQPHHFQACPNLHLIELKSNKISNLPALVFGKNLKLLVVDLSNNLINGIAPCELFQEPNSLDSVYLTGNRCVDAVLRLKLGNWEEIKKQLGLCHSSWIMNQILDNNF